MKFAVLAKIVRNKSAASWRRFAREMSVDMLMVLLALYATYALYFDFNFKFATLENFYFLASATALVASCALMGRRLYSINARYIGLVDFLNLALVGFVSAVALAAFEINWPVASAEKFQAIVPALFMFASTSLLSIVRIGQRLHSWRAAGVPIGGESPQRRRTLIVGAGDAGEMIMREIARSRSPSHLVIGFIDDDPAKSSLRIHSVGVLGTTANIPFLVVDLKIEEILLAMPSVHGEALRRVIELCDQTGARVRTLPAVSALLSGSAHIFQHLRNVEIEDLLRRQPVAIDLATISSRISGERVLITGGGGSIGSELARQIASLAPASLTLLGRGENSIYEIEQELIQTRGFVPSCVVADVRDRQSLTRAFETYRPTVVFHAAAHKHVPLMQGNPIEAIRNNVLGTRLVTELAVNYGVTHFINVSTDKAVKPTSVMGATKRVGEMIVSALGERSETDFGIVRFGNVMGSRGSLIPLLKAQILRGGPVRVTHPDMTRYFMTIPESVQLILQASSLAERGEIFLLDMGQPISILSLAKDLIRLHGLVPGKDIEIQFTGVRPGEKIHEELLYEQEQLVQTNHPKIQMVRNNQRTDWDSLRNEVDRLLSLCDQGEAHAAEQCLMELAWGKSIYTLVTPDKFINP